MPKITSRLIETTEAANKDIIIRDSELKGFLCKVTPKGKKVYMLYYRTSDGRERRPVIGIHGQITCYQARDIALGWLGKVANGEDPSLEKQTNKKSITIAELSERYLTKYAALHKKPRSIEHDNFLLSNHLLPAIGKIKVKSLTSEDISNLHNKMKSTPTTANRCMSLISKMLNLAEKWGIREDAQYLCKHIDKYPENKREKFLLIDQIERLFKILREVENDRTELQSSVNAIKLLLFTGCRLSEILTLKWEFIDIQNFRINFPDSKTGKKTVYISQFVLDILDSIDRQQDNPYVIYGTIKGAHLVNLQKPWRRIRKLAELDDFRIHDLRHSFASIGAASGLSLPMIGALLGHSNSQTTSRYAHLVGDSLKEAATLIGNKINSITN